MPAPTVTVTEEVEEEDEPKPRKKQYGLHFLTGVTTLGIIIVLMRSCCRQMAARAEKKAKIRAQEKFSIIEVKSSVNKEGDTPSNLD